MRASLIVEVEPPHIAQLAVPRQVIQEPDHLDFGPVAIGEHEHVGGVEPTSESGTFSDHPAGDLDPSRVETPHAAVRHMVWSLPDHDLGKRDRTKRSFR